MEMMKASDVCFLKEFPVSMERVQISQPDPQTPFIHVPCYLGNLGHPEQQCPEQAVAMCLQPGELALGGAVSSQRRETSGIQQRGTVDMFYNLPFSPTG
ncbi:hypothetical protein QQF64_025801 [Cirrhinus molitorella]|uniref:Uncharacterized protein n=1 Tax=Cirrhinus molitorella TaxID=172907 RepID=A0ABR3NR39_9TELE